MSLPVDDVVEEEKTPEVKVGEGFVHRGFDVIYDDEHEEQKSPGLNTSHATSSSH